MFSMPRTVWVFVVWLAALGVTTLSHDVHDGGFGSASHERHDSHPGGHHGVPYGTPDTGFLHKVAEQAVELSHPHQSPTPSLKEGVSASSRIACRQLRALLDTLQLTNRDDSQALRLQGTVDKVCGGGQPRPRYPLYHPTVCPGRYKFINGRCYRLSHTPLSWHKARYNCTSSGGDLVSLETKQEEDMLTLLLLKLKVEYSLRLHTSGNRQEDPKVWRWGTGKHAVAVDYTNWLSGEPNDYNKGAEENCLEFQPDMGWNDVPCGLSLRYICEAKPTLDPSPHQKSNHNSEEKVFRVDGSNYYYKRKVPSENHTPKSDHHGHGSHGSPSHSHGSHGSPSHSHGSHGSPSHSHGSHGSPSHSHGSHGSPSHSNGNHGSPSHSNGNHGSLSHSNGNHGPHGLRSHGHGPQGRRSHGPGHGPGPGHGHGPGHGPGHRHPHPLIHHHHHFHHFSHKRRPMLHKPHLGPHPSPWTGRHYQPRNGSHEASSSSEDSSSESSSSETEEKKGPQYVLAVPHPFYPRQPPYPPAIHLQYDRKNKSSNSSDTDTAHQMSPPAYPYRQRHAPYGYPYMAASPYGLHGYQNRVVTPAPDKDSTIHTIHLRYSYFHADDDTVSGDSDSGDDADEGAQSSKPGHSVELGYNYYHGPDPNYISPHLLREDSGPYGEASHSHGNKPQAAIRHYKEQGANTFESTTPPTTPARITSVSTTATP